MPKFRIHLKEIQMSMQLTHNTDLVANGLAIK